VHRALGPGLPGSAYEVCQLHELNKRGRKAAPHLLLPVVYDNFRLDAGPDLVVEKRVVVELKAVEALLPVHKAQLLACLKLSCHRLGLLVNFNSALIKQGIPAIDPLIH
jgi:GxxExxY protein